MSEALQLGFSRKVFYAMRDKGLLEQMSRGLYRLAELPAPGEPDLVVVAKRIPNGVVCLISELAFHELTTQVPHKIDIAIERKSETPRIDYPPIVVHYFSGEAFLQGVEITKLIHPSYKFTA